MSDPNDVMSDEEYAQLLAGGTAQQSLERAMALQQKQAEAMRGATPQGQMVSGHYVAPHAMQYIGEMAKNFSAGKLQSDAQKTGDKMGSAQAAQNSLILKALQRSNAMNKPPAPPVPPGAVQLPYPVNPGAGAA